MTALHPDFLRRPIAHRALHDVNDGRPENSRAAVTAAIAAGYGIEIDLQLSRDSQAMVFHDYDMKRLTGQGGAIQARDGADLTGVPLLGADEAIPTLPEVLDLVAGRVPLLIELKDQHGRMGDTDGRLERAVARDLAGYTGPVGLMSFNPHMVARLAQLAPDLPRGLVTEDFPEHDWPLLPAKRRAELAAIPDFDRVGATFISHSVDDLGNPRVAALRRDGVPVLCWTVRTQAQEAEARKTAQNITFERYLAAMPS